jgi:excisionase family DNA binding protein
VHKNIPKNYLKLLDKLLKVTYNYIKENKNEIIRSKNKMDKFYTVDQISKMLDMHPKTIQRYIREGKLNATKVGKGWRVTGHDLSIFTERPNGTADKIMMPKVAEEPREDKIKISAVVDIDTYEADEAVRIMNMLTAVLNAKPSGYGKSTMSAQFIESERKVRVMLWGNIKFMENMLSSLSVLTDQEDDGREYEDKFSI